MKDDDHSRFRIYLIDDPIVANSDAVLLFSSPKLAQALWERVLGQGFNLLNDSRDFLRIKLA